MMSGFSCRKKARGAERGRGQSLERGGLSSSPSPPWGASYCSIAHLACSADIGPPTLLPPESLRPALRPQSKLPGIIVTYGKAKALAHCTSSTISHSPAGRPLANPPSCRPPSAWEPDSGRSWQGRWGTRGPGTLLVCSPGPPDFPRAHQVEPELPPLKLLGSGSVLTSLRLISITWSYWQPGSGTRCSLNSSARLAISEINKGGRMKCVKQKLGMGP